MATPFDTRIRRVIEINDVVFKSANGSDRVNSNSTIYTQQPHAAEYVNGPGAPTQQPRTADRGNSYQTDYVTNAYTLQPYQVDAEADANSQEDSELYRGAVNRVQKLQTDKTGLYKATASMMNPYAFVRLYGAHGADYLVDRYDKKKWYEIDGSEEGHYAKNPTTSNIIKWGSTDRYGRFPYQYQDFVFCKYWNIIPNNRMVTLRRYTQPTYDNMNFPTMDGTVTMHPVATAVTYFGEGTENTLSDILQFSAGLPWEDEKGSIWTVTSSAPDMAQLNKAFGWDKFASTGTVNAATVLGLIGKHNPFGNENFDADADKGLPQDPYKFGQYVNRILGPVNQINSTKRRAKEGENNQAKELDFQMDNIKLNFHYVARPIAGINGKAILLDIMANLLVMCYASAVFFGGAHRFTVQPTRYPFNDEKARQALWRGKVLGDKGAAAIFVRNFKKKLSEGVGGDENSASIGNVFSAIGDAFRLELGKGLKFLDMENLGKWIKGNADQNGAAVNMTQNLEQQIASTIQGKIGALHYLDNMKATLTGNPVGDWHLVIGNPMNPIAEIGNLVCEDITITFDNELGPDDFPIGFTAQITLAHGMKRDRDGIEAMFNRGAGRIYELPDKYASSADGQTDIDKYTGKKGSGAYRWTDGYEVSARNPYSTGGTTDLAKSYGDAYKTPSGNLSLVDNTINMNDMFYNQDMSGIVHRIMPWQTRIVL